MTTVLALDLASQTGWACGPIGGVPAHGTVRFGASSHEVTFAKALTWMSVMCKLKIDTVVWEAPLATSFSRGHTNVNTTTLLYGLPAVISAVAHLREIYDVRKATTKDVRNHFIGCNPKRVEAKKLTMRQCRAMGWTVEDDNEADALATWSYMCALIDPKLAVLPTPLLARQTHTAGDQAGDVGDYTPALLVRFNPPSGAPRPCRLVWYPGVNGGCLERQPDRRVPHGLLGAQASVVESERVNDRLQPGDLCRITGSRIRWRFLHVCRRVFHLRPLCVCGTG
jgi:hypothetical protein